MDSDNIQISTDIARSVNITFCIPLSKFLIGVVSKVFPILFLSGLSPPVFVCEQMKSCGKQIAGQAFLFSWLYIQTFLFVDLLASGSAPGSSMSSRRSIQ